MGDVGGPSPTCSNLLQRPSVGGQARPRRRAPPGETTCGSINISFTKGCIGQERDVADSPLETAATCSGSGARRQRPPVAPRRMPARCVAPTRTPSGSFSPRCPCPVAKAAAQVIANLLRRCGGQGVSVRKTCDTIQRRRFRHPACVLAVEGNAASGVAPSDLTSTCRCRPQTSCTAKAPQSTPTWGELSPGILGDRSKWTPWIGPENPWRFRRSVNWRCSRSAAKGCRAGQSGRRANHLITIKVQLPTTVAAIDGSLLETTGPVHHCRQGALPTRAGLSEALFGLWNVCSGN